MRFPWLLSGALGAASSLLIAVSAEAGTLETWRFNTTENRLVFTTDEGVQPTAQLIADPVRLVIDLPGITLGRTTTRQTVGGGIREVRVGQVDGQTARIVIELEPGYMLDPQQILVRGATPTEWSVQLPRPQRDASVPAPGAPSSPSPGSIAQGTTRIDGLQVTSTGFFVRTSGAAAQLQLERSRDSRDVIFTIRNAALGPQVQQEISLNSSGVERIRFEPQSGNPASVRMSLRLSGGRRDRDRRGWQASTSNLGGIVLLPSRNADSSVVSAPPPTATPSPTPPPTRPTPAPRPGTPSSGLSTIEAVELSSDGRQLLIRADGAIAYVDEWDRGNTYYRITIPDARLAERVIGPQLSATTSLQQVRLQQQDERTVVILVQPASGIRVGSIVQPTQRLLALQLSGTVRPSPTPPGASPSPFPPPTTELPRVPNGRVVVVIDPGHGGPDPGAVGIGGLREKDVVLPISLQVASILEQQGVQVVLTRRDDRDLDLEPRVQMAERANASLFVSIHANSMGLNRPDVNGVETYYYDTGSDFARTIHNSIMRNLNMGDRGVRSARFYVLRNTSMPAVLVETGFVTGSVDAPQLADSRWRSQMAVAIAQGILQYIQQRF